MDRPSDEQTIAGALLHDHVYLAVSVSGIGRAFPPTNLLLVLFMRCRRSQGFRIESQTSGG